MAHFFLVHGAWQGAWAWDNIVARLEAAGHAATAVDLPGNGHDDTPPGDVSVMRYAEHIAGLIDAIPQDGPDSEPVIVVGHSMGGTATSQVCELRPGRIAVAVYLCAFLLRDGESVVDFYDRA